MAADPRRRYWRANLLIVAVLLVVWGLLSFGCGILWAPALNEHHLGGFPLGFWFAQQGSILGFVLLLLVYAVLLDRLDRWLAGATAGSGDSA